LEALDVAQEGVELGWLQRYLRHAVAGLERLRIGNPAGQVTADVGKRCRREGSAGGDMREIRAVTAEEGRRAAHRVAKRAAAVEEEALTMPGQIVDGLGGWRPLPT
jgi:hypothetical protein